MRVHQLYLAGLTRCLPAQWSLAGVIVIMITTLSTASPSYQPGRFVFAEFINETGWVSELAFPALLGQS